MRKPRKSSRLEFFRRLLHLRAARSDGFASSPRQICPPSAGLSSTRRTLAPHSAALTAAAMPAGPPPITTMSQLCLFIDVDLHSLPAQHLAALHVMHAVHRDSTLEANSHTAQWTTWLP